MLDAGRWLKIDTLPFDFFLSSIEHPVSSIFSSRSVILIIFVDRFSPDPR
jgi:hypothetical protein